MTTTMTEKTFNRLFNVARFVLILAFVGMIVVALHPEVRTEARTTLMKDFRMVVSTATAQGDLLGDGSKVTVAKIKTRDSLLLEVYQALADGTERLVERIELPHRKDGFFNFNGKATNLVIEDIDGDGRPEILAPGFDQNMVGHLNIYRYNQSEGSFQRALR
jgi:hypothetical protein